MQRRWWLDGSSPPFTPRGKWGWTFQFMELNLKWPTLQFKLGLSFCPRKQVTVHSHPLPRLASWIKLSVPLPCYWIQETAMESGSILINSSSVIVDLKNLFTRTYLGTPCIWFYLAVLSSILKVYTHREFDSLKSKSTWTCRYYFFFKIKRVQNLGDQHRGTPSWEGKLVRGIFSKRERGDSMVFWGMRVIHESLRKLMGPLDCLGMGVGGFLTYRSEVAPRRKFKLVDW